MSPAEPVCIRCGVELAPDQEYCLECGSRRAAPVGERWRRPLIAAAVTLMVAGLVLLFGYQRMRDDAESDAGPARPPQGQKVRQAAASVPLGGSGNRKPAREAPAGDRPSP
jgi:hypothetical protein